MFEYYAGQEVQPTYADFRDDVALSKYEQLRKLVFARLALPAAIFQSASLLEFGPDTGENSLIFARWGAQLTLVEPNAKAHAYIRRYFAKFGLERTLGRCDPDFAARLQARQEIRCSGCGGFHIFDSTHQCLDK